MTNRQLPKAYDPADVETKWYRHWLEQDYFRADATAPKMPYTIVLPPPNVTGSLHMGHALTVTIQDTLIRWRRMQGYNALWLPGVDHAGIATQVVVERLLKREGKTRHDLGREQFLARVWQWKEKSGGRIVEQMRVMGASLDWSRERFTMDESLSAAVREAFVRLYEDGLIYRAKRLINWCARCRTALSDLEVESKDEQGSLWHIAYPVAAGAGAPGERLVVATTRPETLLGDTAVAVHPDDPRFRHLIGKQVEVPLTGRTVSVIGDAELVSMEFGTGAVKVTPGHDFNDFETGVRHGLEQLSILDLDGKICAPAPAKYVGLSVAEARAQVLADLEAAGLLVETKPHALALGRCQRCDSVAEPMLSMQWFVKAKTLAEPAIAAVNEGKTRFVPELWTKTYMHWMTNIRDWCISRQLWWGHRIPAWYCDACGGVTVGRQDPSACSGCGGAALRQDDDVLDTWFSSALWPFSTLGWPEATRDLKTFYPTSVMETGYDILFFWVARMMMMGLHFQKKVPFRVVYLHAMVVDENGDKMSKVKGNVIDPLDVIHGADKATLVAKAKEGGAPDQALRYIDKSFPEGIPASGADALRFALCAMAAQGRNIRLAIPRIEGYRHFANKIWNASRFALMNLDGFDADRFADAMRDGPRSAGLGLAERWILSRLHRLIREVDEAMEAFRLNDAAQALYRFIWTEACDWFIELAKPQLHDESDSGDHEAATRRRQAQGTLAAVLEHAMRLLHPFMPFLTEEIWQQLPKPSGAPGSIMITLYPIADEAMLDDEAERHMQLIMDVTTALRNIRAEYDIAMAKPLEVRIYAGDPAQRDVLVAHGAIVERLVKARLKLDDAPPAVAGFAARAVVGATVEILVPLADVVDVAAEKARLGKELAKAQKDIETVEKKLTNPAFVDKAPPAVVDEHKARLDEAKGRVGKLAAALAALASAGRP
jgi:valyl-tRNA synthetase